MLVHQGSDTKLPINQFKSTLPRVPDLDPDSIDRLRRHVQCGERTVPDSANLKIIIDGNGLLFGSFRDPGSSINSILRFQTGALSEAMNNQVLSSGRDSVDSLAYLQREAP